MNQKSGFTLVEVLVSLTILGIVIVMFVGAFSNSIHAQNRAKLRLQATQYARESAEVVYNLSRRDWDSLTQQIEAANPDTVFHPALNNNLATLQAGEETVGQQFQRSIQLEWATRDNQGNVTNGQGQEDPTTIKVTSTVELPTFLPDKVTIISYLSQI